MYTMPPLSILYRKSEKSEGHNASHYHRPQKSQSLKFAFTQILNVLLSEI